MKLGQNAKNATYALLGLAAITCIASSDKTPAQAGHTHSHTVGSTVQSASNLEAKIAAAKFDSLINQMEIDFKSRVADDVYTFIEDNGSMPNYADSTALYKVMTAFLTDMQKVFAAGVHDNVIGKAADKHPMTDRERRIVNLFSIANYVDQALTARDSAAFGAVYRSMPATWYQQK